MREIKVVTNVLKANERVSEQNRQIFQKHNLLVMNVIGSPGAGKTTLLEGLIERLSPGIKMGVIEGDIYTTRDAARIEKYGIQVVQINTGGGCHLDAPMVQEALENLILEDLNLLIIENVGNLVCPAAFNLGEDFKMVVMSITEGDDKPEKYPRIFQESKVMAVTKIDLLAYNQFEMTQFLAEVKGIQPEIEIFTVSNNTGEGLDQLAEWLTLECQKKQTDAVGFKV